MDTPQQYLQQVRAAVDRARSELGDATAAVGVVLGSGLADSLPRLEGSRAVPYGAIPGFPQPTVKGHAGQLRLGLRSGRGVAVLQGRLHYYEGHSMGRVVFPLHILKGLGVRTLVLTSAVGSMNPKLRPGSLVILKDHINFMGSNPLRGLIGPDFGEMFPDMSEPYDPALRKAAMLAAKRLKIPAAEGVYAAVAGPSYETPAEIRAFRKLGADVVGMSTVPEVIAARQMGMRVLTVSWIANMAAGVSRQALSHAEVLEFGRTVSGRIRSLLEAVLDTLP